VRALLALGVLGCGHAAPPKTVQLNAPGAVVNIEAALVAGYVTVVDFWSETCEPCHVATAKLTAGVAADPEIRIVKVDVGDGVSPVAAAYEIGALPHYRIYDKHKRLRYFLVGKDCLDATAMARALVAE
jgi:thiol-disulfide isomerase/thioredoxin